MWALTMILAAALAVPGDVPEKVSAEVKRSPQPLDLRGEWKGTLRNYHGLCAKVQLSGGRLIMEDNTGPGESAADFPVSFVDEGNGKFRLRLNFLCYLGIYRKEGDSFIGCFSEKHRPSEFKLTERRGLIELHRVKHGH